MHLLFVLSPHVFPLYFSAQNQDLCSEHLSPTEQSLVSMADVLLHHHAATELLLCSQTQLLHVRICAGVRAHAPHHWFGHDGEGALCCRLGLLLQASVMVRVGLLADVETSLEKVSSRGHGGQRRGVAR